MSILVPSSNQSISAMSRAELIAYLSVRVAAREADERVSRRTARIAVATETGLSNLTVARLVDLEHEV